MFVVYYILLLHTTYYILLLLLKIKNKNLYELHRGINKNRKEWEIEHQLVIENKCCENKNINVEV
jgi:hypothetical protein